MITNFFVIGGKSSRFEELASASLRRKARLDR